MNCRYAQYQKGDPLVVTVTGPWRCRACNHTWQSTDDFCGGYDGHEEIKGVWYDIVLLDKTCPNCNEVLTWGADKCDGITHPLFVITASATVGEIPKEDCNTKGGK